MNKTINLRLNEFCVYHRDGDGECNSIVLKKWADIHKLNLQQRWELAYMFAVTYSVPSAIILFNNPTSWDNPNQIKDKLIFQSDRKYVKMLNNFKGCLDYFKAHLRNVYAFLDKFIEEDKINLEKAIKEVEGWFFFGRFSAFLFLEMFVWLTDIPITNTTIDWKNGDTATSGLLNLFGYDNMANEFDKSGKLFLEDEKLDHLLDLLKYNISKIGGTTNVTCIETSLCAYRKHYKGSRYNGYYLDRMLEEINFIKPNYPNIAEELFDIRRKNFDGKYLGELNNWSGIRKDKKKLYKITGEMM